MTRFYQTLAIIIFGLGVTACSNDSPASPSPASVQRFTTNLSAANEVPPIAGTEAGVSGTATLTFNLTRSASGAINAATLDIAVTASGFPNGTALTNAHIHSAATGTNGAVSWPPVSPPARSRFRRVPARSPGPRFPSAPTRPTPFSPNPGAFYFNIHTTRNPDGVARGQLAPAQ